MTCKIIQFPGPKSELIDRAGGFEIYEFKEKPAAKSSTSVLQASVCQSCGCKLDGKVESMKPGCSCRCHKDGAR